MLDLYDQHGMLHERSFLLSLLGQYVLSVICIVILCAIMQMLVPTRSAGALVKMVTGLVVTVAVLSPVLKDRVFQFDIRLENIMEDGKQAIAEGETLSSESYTHLIKEKTQAYIENKASGLGIAIRAEVSVHKEYPNAPETVTIRGVVPPYAKKQLSQSICDALGILEENQIWISQN